MERGKGLTSTARWVVCPSTCSLSSKYSLNGRGGGEQEETKEERESDRVRGLCTQRTVWRCKLLSRDSDSDWAHAD